MMNVLQNHSSTVLVRIWRFFSFLAANSQSADDLKFILWATLTLGFVQVQSSYADGHTRQKAEGNRPF